MKSRRILILLVTVGIVGGLVYWWWPTADINVGKAKARTKKQAAHTDASSGAKPANEVVDPSGAEDSSQSVQNKAAVANTGSASAKGMRYPQAHPRIGAAIQATLDQYYANPQMVGQPGPPVNMPDRTKLEIQPPLAIYRLRTNDYLNGSGLAAAEFTDYLYFLNSSGKLAASMMLSVDPQGMPLYDNLGVPISSSVQVFYSDAVLNRSSAPVVVQSLARLAVLDQVRQGSYEARMLELPAYRISAAHATGGSVIWLKSDAAGKDLFYTLPSTDSYTSRTNPGLKPDTLYTTEDLLKAIRPAVQAFQESQAQ